MDSFNLIIDLQTIFSGKFNKFATFPIKSFEICEKYISEGVTQSGFDTTNTGATFNQLGKYMKNPKKLINLNIGWHKFAPELIQN